MKSFIVLILLAFAAHAFAFDDSAEYFEQFTYVKESISEDPDFPQYQYRFVSTKFDDKIPMADGRYLNPSVSLFVNPDSSFVVTYKENYFESLTSTTFMPGPCRKIEGKWKVDKEQLVLEGFATAVKAIVDNKNALEITYEKDIVSAGLKGHKVTATYAYANYGVEEALMMCF